MIVFHFQLYPSPARTQLDSELSLDDRTAAEILTSHTVEITKAVNLNNLRPYLIGNRCVTLSESRQQLFKSASDTDTVIQFIEIVSKRGISAFRGFLKALEQYTTDEPSEGALIELLNKLRDDAASKLPTAPQNEPVIVVQQTPAETTIDLPEDPETESQDALLSSNEQGQPNKDASAVTASVTRVSYLLIKDATIKRCKHVAVHDTPRVHGCLACVAGIPYLN